MHVVTFHLPCHLPPALQDHYQSLHLHLTPPHRLFLKTPNALKSLFILASKPLITVSNERNRKAARHHSQIQHPTYQFSGSLHGYLLFKETR
jgi:hypothetical protein